MAWTTPITWTSGQTVTASQMNTEIRDHANWLKAALDLVTNSTASDTGTATYLRVVRAAAGNEAFRVRVSGDTVDRFAVLAGGSLEWSPGNAANDINLQRLALATMGTSLVTASTSGTAAKLLATWVSGTNELNGSAVGVYDTADQDRHALLGFLGANVPMVAFGRDTGSPMYLSRESASALTVRAAAALDPAQLEVRVATTGEQHSLFTLVAGEIQPRVTLGMDSSNRARLGLGGGGSTAPDATLFRAGARMLGSVDQLDLQGGGLIIPIVAGTPTDANVPGSIKVGALIYDQSANKLWVRDNDGNWKQTAALT